MTKAPAGELVALRVKDFAIVDAIEVEFDRGLTVLTGETGAGKSILVDALTLALGGRASSELVRSGAEAAEVEALFDLTGATAVKEFLSTSGLMEAGEDELVIRRVISRSGKNRVWINGRQGSAGRLFELGRFLVDVYGQHEYQTLLQQDQHRGLLDSFGGLDGKLEHYRGSWSKLKSLKDELAALDLNETQRREREDLLLFRVREIETIGPEPGEDERLALEREVLRHAETLKLAAMDGAAYVYENDDAVVGGLRKVADELRAAAIHDPWFTGPADQVDSATALLEDAAQELIRRADKIEADPKRLEWVEDRVHAIKRLTQKHGGTVGDVLAALESARAELSSLTNFEDRRSELGDRVAAAEKDARAAADKLTRARKKTGKALARGVEDELSSLGMDQTRFEVRLDRMDEGLGPFGGDSVSFYLSPNPGEDLKPLEKIASGGELSRIMLALRVLLSGEGESLALVFDEVDAGIGGAVAEAVGLRMRSLADRRQVLCVTHLPQIASLAHNHLRVSKRSAADRTKAEVEQLAEKERIEEVARMLSGRDVTKATRAHAQEMLKRAGDGASTPPRGKAKKTG